MQRWVGCVRIERLYTRVEQECGAPPPLAVADGKAIRDACPLARRAGVVPGTPEMPGIPGTPVATARRLCAGLTVIPYDARRYRAAANRWMRLGLDHAPWLEPLAPHEAFLDLSDHPDPEGAIHAVHRAVTGLGYTARAAVAPNKLVARAATLVPDTWDAPVTLVPPGAEAAFLAPWPVRALWPLDRKTLERLERLEYENVAEIAAAAVSELKGQVGRAAALVHALAHGQYFDPVRPFFPEETIRCRVRWTEGLEQADDVFFAAATLAAAAARDLGGRCCRVLSLTLEMEDLSRMEARETRRMLDRTSLPRAARRLAERLEPPAPVVGMAIVAAALADPPPLEGDLFSLDRIRRQRALSEAMLCLEERFGKRVLLSGADIPVPWRERAWQAFWQRHRGSLEARAPKPEGRKAVRAPSGRSRVPGLKPQVLP